MGRNQIGVVALGLCLLLSLFFFAPNKKGKKQKLDIKTNQPTSKISFQDFEKKSKKELTASLLSNLDALEGNLTKNSSSPEEKENSIRKIADFWKSQNNTVLTAWYSFKIAETNKLKVAYENACNNFLIALNSEKDSLISNNLITFALLSFENAEKQGETSVDLKIKLARLYTEKSQDPMKGIGLLRGIIEKDSNNIPTLIELGRLSIMSGQYEKAKDRLEKVMKLQPENTEALYFLAVTNEGLGNKDLAIKQLEMCKIMVANPEFDIEINEYIKNLKNK